MLRLLAVRLEVTVGDEIVMRLLHNTSMGGDMLLTYMDDLASSKLICMHEEKFEK